MSSTIFCFKKSHPGLAALGCTLLSLLGAPPGRCLTAQDYRHMADHDVAIGQYAQASECYRAEAQIYRKVGDPNAAAVEDMKAERWSTSIGLYAGMAPVRSMALELYTGAKFEPVYGCYVGCYVEADDRLFDVTDDRGDRLIPEEAFGQLVGKKVATAFQYCHYGRERFPRWAKELSRHGIVPHVSLEPNDGLSYVNDDEYLEQFARDAASCRGPVFLRFGAEMNGDWTNYHNDPALYREKFRLVHDVMARLAPNVAMIWCPAAIPIQYMDRYYPGDDAVDWVGVNMYSVMHHNNDASMDASHENPVSFLKYVYHQYAARKPIAICEYGSSHREALNPYADHSDVASSKIAELFAALPREFPRVKLVDIFDCNNLQHARPGRQLNDYSVTDSLSVLSAFRQAVAPDYFLSDVYTRPQQDLPTYLHPLWSGTVYSGVVHLSAWIQTYEDRPTVQYALDGREIGRIVTPGDYSLMLDTAAYRPGPHRLTLTVLDSRGHRAGQKEATLMFGGADAGGVIAER